MYDDDDTHRRCGNPKAVCASASSIPWRRACVCCDARAFPLCAGADMCMYVCMYVCMYAPPFSHMLLQLRVVFRLPKITPENLLLVDERGNVLKGDGAPDSTAFWIHSRIHKARPEDARCILHTHMPWSTALCCLENGRLEMCHQNCLRFYEDISYDPEFNGLVLDESEGDRLCKMMGDKKVLFHANHGVIVVGKSVAEAFDDLYYLERAAEVVVKAMSTGRPLKMIDTETCEEFQRQMAIEGNARWANLHFDALKRKLKRGIEGQMPFTF